MLSGRLSGWKLLLVTRLPRVYTNVRKPKSKVNVKNEDKAPYFSVAPVESYYEPPFPRERLRVDTEAWIGRLKGISDLFNGNMNITQGDATLTYEVERRYFTDTEGRSVVENLPYARLMIQGGVTALDGMYLPLFLSYFAYDPADLPADEQIMADIREMIKTLLALREAPVGRPVYRSCFVSRYGKWGILP